MLITPKLLRHWLIVSVTFIGGFYFFLEFVIPESLLNQLEPILGHPFSIVHEKISTGVQLVGTMAIGLGIINLLQIHFRNLIRKRGARAISLALLVGLFTTFTIELLDLINSEKRLVSWQRISNLELFIEVIKKQQEETGVPATPRVLLLLKELETITQDAASGNGFLRVNSKDLAIQEAGIELLEKLSLSKNQALAVAQSYQANENINETISSLTEALKQASAAARTLSELNYEATLAKKAAHFSFEAFFVPLGSAMFSLLAFYIATAAYRTFRVKSLEALLMMTAAVLVMLGQIPLGPLYISSSLPDIRLWLLKYVSSPAFRAIFFGASIAGLSMAVRMWLSLEKSPLAVDDEPQSAIADKRR